MRRVDQTPDKSPQPTARGFASGLRYSLVLALSLTRSFPQGGRENVLKKQRLDHRREESVAVFGSIDWMIFLAAIILDGNSQVCFHESMLTKAIVKIIARPIVHTHAL
jgi:hypothetical protein